jgi:glutamate transport system permease protein
MHVLLDNWGTIGRGFLQTLELAGASTVACLIVGQLLAVMRVSPIPPLRWFASGYVTVVRNTPLTLVFVIVVHGLPEVGLRGSFFTRAVISLSVYTAAFVCEVLRSGMLTVPTGQAEAARALGMTFPQTLGQVVLPQAVRAAIPPLGNVWIAMVKNTSIAAGFAVTELTASMQRLSNAQADQLVLVLLAVVVGYCVITVPSAWVVHRLERKVAVLR